MKRMLLLAAFACSFAAVSLAADAIALPAPDKTGGKPLAQALSDRQSNREFADVALSQQDLADLLWSVAGVNRPDGRRVHPVAMGRQDMIVFAFTRDGAYRYNPLDHTLVPVGSAAGDNRAATGGQPFVGSAAANLVFVQDLDLWIKSDQERAAGANFGYAHTGAMMQNGYLFAASRGWAAVVRGYFDEEKISDLLDLGDNLRVRLVLSIGPGK